MFASFYYIDSEYIKYLQNKEIENRGFTCVPNVDYANKTKFTYGVVMDINSENGIKIPYFVPVTSYDKKQEDNIPIRVKKDKIMHSVGSLRFNYMFPVPAIKKCIKEVDFKNKKYTEDYKRLLEQEYRYIKKTIGPSQIQKQAKATYERVLEGNDENLIKNSCDFKLLERAYLEYLELIKEKSQNPPTPPTISTSSDNNGLGTGGSTTDISDDSGITDNIVKKIQSVLQDFRESLIDIPRQLSEAHESCISTHKQVLNLEHIKQTIQHNFGFNR